MDSTGSGGSRARAYPCARRHQIGRRTRNGVCQYEKERSRGPLCDPYSPARQCGRADRRSRNRSRSPVVRPLQADGYSWRIGEPRRRSFGDDSSGRRANRQDHQRNQPSRHSRRAADALRTLHQLEDGPFAEPDHPANPARPRRRDHRMRRRDLVALVAGGAITWSLAAPAEEPTKVARIGFLGLTPAAASTSRVEALQTGLRELGWIEGKNILIEFRWAPRVDQLPDLAAELVRMEVDIIFAPSSTFVEPARKATQTIPIVFALDADPVGLGHVASLARPGGNITGLTMQSTELNTKQLEILKEALPQSTRFGVLWNPSTPSHQLGLPATQAAGDTLGITLIAVPARTAEDFDRALMTMADEHVGGFLDLASPLSYSERARLAELALKYRLPGMFGIKANAEAGGLMSYAADINDLHRRAAAYIDKILKGAKPADLPVEQASKFELIINLKTAKALGLTIPPLILARADEVIE